MVCSSLSPSEEAAGVLGQVGAIQDILTAMRSFPHNLELVSSCCTALWSLSVIGQNLPVVYCEFSLHCVAVELMM